ncbi:hypothetical protein HanXRQr2_Chr13g0586341 [Helianthus annuus]|uniref:Uncharacterized protein n=1 Tax=Helianthus annuus TaxID=4232 RepID=A0A251SR76_HELAN|nr:hypothetical protein HanXRQr2_Chr13g0586341 [Helianthus annuus]
MWIVSIWGKARKVNGTSKRKHVRNGHSRLCKSRAIIMRNRDRRPSHERDCMELIEFVH